MGGVVELGSTELISEDMELIERLLKTSQQTVKPTTPCSTDYNSNFAADLLPSSKFTADHIFDDETDIVVNQSVEQDLNITSLDDCSIGSASPSHDGSIQLLKGATTSYDSRKNLNLGGVRNVSTDFPDTETGADIHYNIRTGQMIDFQSRYSPNYLLQPCEPCDLNVVHFRTDNVPSYAFQEERECEKFMILRSMVPSLTKLQSDELSIHSVVSHDTLEVKNSEVDDFGMDLERSTPTDGLEKATETDIMQFIDVEMSALNNDVQVELSCSWREHLLLNVMKALHNLDLDTHTVQSSTYGGAFFLSLKAKFRGAAFASEDVIKQALMRVINNN